MYRTDFDSEFYEELQDLKEDDPKKYDIILKKCIDIAKTLEWSPKHYKNLESPLNKFKRVHLIDNHYVLVFRVNKWDKSVLFVACEHHDDIYVHKRLFEY